MHTWAGCIRTVNSMAILCLWSIQLTFYWNGIEPYGTYHSKSKIVHRKHVQAKYAEVIAVLESERSMQMDNSHPRRLQRTPVLQSELLSSTHTGEGCHTHQKPSPSVVGGQSDHCIIRCQGDGKSTGDSQYLGSTGFQE